MLASMQDQLKSSKTQRQLKVLLRRLNIEPVGVKRLKEFFRFDRNYTRNVRNDDSGSLKIFNVKFYDFPNQTIHSTATHLRAPCPCAVHTRGKIQNKRHY